MVLRRGFFEKILSRTTTTLSNKLFKETYFTIFSISVLTPSKLSKLGHSEKTVLHLHNWFNLMNVTQIERLLRRGFRLVVTLHDQRFFTGGCHYSMECEGFTGSCASCPLLPCFSLNSFIRRNHKKLLKLVAKYNNQFVFLAPSKWIYNEALRSSILKDSRVVFLPNVHSEFANELNSKEKSSHANRSKKFTVGVASMDPSSPLKGSEYVLDVIQVLSHEKERFQFKQLAQYSGTTQGYLNFWREIDCLLVLSRADNSPNVIHEAKIAGIPIIGTKIGGISELLNPSIDYIFEIEPNLVNNVAQTIVKISKEQRSMPNDIGLRYKSSDSQGDLDGFLRLYSEFN